MQLRGVNINCELTREAHFYSQLHGDTPAGTVEPGLPSRKTWPDETDEVNLMTESEIVRLLFTLLRSITPEFLHYNIFLTQSSQNALLNIVNNQS